MAPGWREFAAQHVKRKDGMSPKVIARVHRWGCNTGCNSTAASTTATYDDLQVQLRL